MIIEIKDLPKNVRIKNINIDFDENNEIIHIDKVVDSNIQNNSPSVNQTTNVPSEMSEGQF